MRQAIGVVVVGAMSIAAFAAQEPERAGRPTRAEVLRGEYGRYRANNDLLYYHLPHDREKLWYEPELIEANRARLNERRRAAGTTDARD